MANLTLCCHECIIIKSTSDKESFMGLLKLLESNPTLKNKMLHDLWLGRLANQIDRKLLNE